MGSKTIRRLGLAVLCSLTLTAAGQTALTDSVSYRVEMQATLADGDHNPLWLNANRHGLSSLKTTNGYLRAALQRPLAADSARRWAVGYGADVAVGSGMTSTAALQQAYAEVRWLKGVLTVGAREFPMQLKNQLLSTGSQTLGINARPLPQVRLALPDYWTIPHLGNWLAVKGHVAYGMQTDDRWQKDFTHCENRYTEHALTHTKAGYLRIGPGNITLELGLEMACQFGGKNYLVFNGIPGEVYDNDVNLKTLWHALIPGGGDTTDGSSYQNAQGNHLGSWVGRLNLDFEQWNLGLYADHFFEDHSAMLQHDYDGYGTGEHWDEKTTARYFRYDLKDIMLGTELTLKRLPWLSSIVVEYLYTKYQSGPVYHDHTPAISNHISGRDNYYNHHLYTGWQHWGMVMGNPLYLSPLYNDNGRIEVFNNRFMAWHLGLAGHPAAGLHYRLLATWQRGLGTYTTLYREPREDMSLMAEACYGLPSGWSVKAAIALDSGRLYGDNKGLQLTIAKTGLLNLKKRK